MKVIFPFLACFLVLIISCKKEPYVIYIAGSDCTADDIVFANEGLYGPNLMRDDLDTITSTPLYSSTVNYSLAVNKNCNSRLKITVSVPDEFKADIVWLCFMPVSNYAYLQDPNDQHSRTFVLDNPGSADANLAFHGIGKVKITYILNDVVIEERLLPVHF